MPKALPGVDRGDDRRRRARHRPLLRSRHQGPAAIAIDRVRFVGEPVVAVAAERPGDRRRGAHADRRRVRGAAASRSRSTRRWPTDAPASARRHRAAAPGSLPRAGRDPTSQPGNVCYHHAFARGDVEAAVRRGRYRRRGRVPLPGGLPVRDGAAHHDRPVDGATTSSPSGPPASTRSWSAPRSPISSRLPVGERADRRALPRRRLRQQVVHQDGADHRRRWPARRGARCGSPTASTRRWSPPAATA